jgi:hypothetical protein
MSRILQRLMSLNSSTAYVAQFFNDLCRAIPTKNCKQAAAVASAEASIWQMTPLGLSSAAIKENSLFPTAQMDSLPNSSAHSAWEPDPTTSENATQRPFTTVKKHYASGSPAERSSDRQVFQSASIGSEGSATRPPSTTITSVRAAEARIMELRAGKLEAHTPYKGVAWEAALRRTGLIQRYPFIPHSLRTGFYGGIPTISETFTPPNSKTIEKHAAEFRAIVNLEFKRCNYLGPFTRKELESIIGPFQTAPLSLVPKAGKPGKFRLTQNLSFPYTPRDNRSSINSAIDSNLYPCTWGTFNTVSLTISRLPPGSEAATRDVATAYRTIPWDHSQWPGVVVRIGSDSFALDTQDCFGISSGAGVYGSMADAGTDIIRSEGFGPVSKWVDDHLFFRIRWEYLGQYNNKRLFTKAAIESNGGRLQSGGKYWFKGGLLQDGRVEEFDEDMQFPLTDHSRDSPRSLHDQEFTYNLTDIDAISEKLGIPWELSKDRPFSHVAVYFGFSWNLTASTVAIPSEKKEKYLEGIHSWQSRQSHVLEQVQVLYGRLLHSCLVIPSGRAYITGLESMLSIFHNNPFMPRTPAKSIINELLWWDDRLSRSDVSRKVPGDIQITDLFAFSDASSGIGIGIFINGWWRAWRLLPKWNADGRDIGWAEAIGFEFLVKCLFKSRPFHSNILVYGDNKGVVEGWWNGRSKNRFVNDVFRRIHDVCEQQNRNIYTAYVRSEDNPADGPSRGKLPSKRFLLPPIDIPEHLRGCIVDFDEPLSQHETELKNRASNISLGGVRQPRSQRDSTSTPFIPDNYDEWYKFTL